MKLQKTTTIAALALFSAGILGASANVFAGPNGDTYESNGVVRFKPDDSKTPPTDPNNPDTDKNVVDPWDPTTPDHKPNPGTQGPLSIDYASSLDFGTNLIDDSEHVYYAEAQYYFGKDGKKDLTSAVPNYLQVTDKRGSNDGWTVTVKQENQLQTVNSDVLDGAQISLPLGTIMQNKATTVNPAVAPKAYAVTLTPGAAVKVMGATKEHGMYTWINRFGTNDDLEVTGSTDIDGKPVKRNKTITLTVPGATYKKAAEYKSVLTWEIKATPDTVSFVNPGE